MTRRAAPAPSLRWGDGRSSEGRRRWARATRPSQVPTLSAGLREDFHWESSESKSVMSGVKKERTQCQFHLEVELSGARNGGGGGVDGHRSIAPQTTNLSTEINCFFMRARPQRKEEDK